MRVTFPFAWIESQIARGSVEVPGARFLEALPADLPGEFQLAEDDAVSLPLDEVLLNLPARVEEAEPKVKPAEKRTPLRKSEATATPAPPLTDQFVLQAILMTEEELDLEKIAKLIGALPGLDGCAVASGDRRVEAGEMPAQLRENGEIYQVAAALEASAGEAAVRLGLGKLKSQTLHCEGSLVTFFSQQHIGICVFHRRPFVPGVREKLDAVAGQMARSM